MKEHIVHSGAWGPALIVVVMASWLLYRYLAQARADVHPALGAMAQAGHEAR